MIFAYHGYPWLIHRLTYRRANHDGMHVRGYKEEGTTTTPFDMVMLNDMDRFHLVMDVIDRVPGLGPRAAHLRQAMVDERLRHRAYTRETGDDMPERARLGLGGVVVPTGAPAEPMLIERLLPDHDAVRVEHRVMPGSPEAVFEATRQADFLEAWRGSRGVRLLFGARSAAERVVSAARGRPHVEPPPPEALRLSTLPRERRPSRRALADRAGDLELLAALHHQHPDGRSGAHVVVTVRSRRCASRRAGRRGSRDPRMPRPARPARARRRHR